MNPLIDLTDIFNKPLKEKLERTKRVESVKKRLEEEHNQRECLREEESRNQREQKRKSKQQGRNARKRLKSQGKPIT